MLAYLISAYRDAAHLARLVNTLDHDADFYIHVDGNVDDRPFREALAGRATFVRRHKVGWGGWNQVEYQRELLAAAINSGRHYSHLVCLSAQDYPLWSNSRIHRFFEENATREFIGGYNLTRGDNEGQRQKVTMLHPFRDLPWKNRWLKNKVIVASRNMLRWMGVKRKPQVTMGGGQKDIFVGSDYWAITPQCARHVLQTLDNEPKMTAFFKRTFAPSELCIHTIVYNSPFATRAMPHDGSYPGLAALTPLHFIDYGACVKVLDLADLPRLMQSGKMFCRKVETGTSDALADEIDKSFGA